MRAVQTQGERWQEQTRGGFWETDGLIAFTTDLQVVPSTILQKLWGDRICRN